MLMNTKELDVVTNKRLLNLDDITLSYIAERIAKNIMVGNIVFKFREDCNEFIMSDVVIEALKSKGYQIEHKVYDSGSERDHYKYNEYRIIWSGDRFTSPGTFKRVCSSYDVERFLTISLVALILVFVALY